jgi:hypothetical protein
MPLMPRPVPYPQPVRIEPVPGEPFGLAILPAPSTMSGPAIGSMISGIGSLLVAGVVWCFGLVGAKYGWGGLVSGAFAVLTVLLGVAALALGGIALRVIRGTRQMKGRGNAIAGMICGGAGVLLAVAGVAIAIVLSAQSTAG